MIAQTQAPAKLNLFLELLSKRPDGYHEIDTVMVAIDWCDTIELTCSEQPGIRLSLEWLPSLPVVANQLGVDPESEIGRSLLDIPTDHRNLIHKALFAFAKEFSVSCGFECRVGKRIPAGAGMGGASSNAATVLMAAANLCGISPAHPKLADVAASIGSDVSFFLGNAGQGSVRNTMDASFTEVSSGDEAPCGKYVAARGTGRGEQIAPVPVGCDLDLVVVFPGRMLSTPRVYSHAKIPPTAHSAQKMIQALGRGDRNEIASAVFNRLSEPAVGIEPKVKETLEVMRRFGLKGCQMTGSGSACFGLASSTRHAKRIETKLTAELQPGAFVRACRTLRVPSTVIML